MKVIPLSALLLCAFPIMGFAHKIKINQMLPSVAIAQHGELVVQDKDIAYQYWSSEQMLGKVRIVQAIAGRKSAKKMNADLMSAISASKFSEEAYQTTTIINQDDAIWGTSSFVKSSAEESKVDFPWSSIVLDKNGKVAKTWQLDEKSSAIIVLDKTGSVLFVKEGALDQAEIRQVLALVEENL